MLIETLSRNSKCTGEYWKDARVGIEGYSEEVLE
jgi:hypothetical protein